MIRTPHRRPGACGPAARVVSWRWRIGMTPRRRPPADAQGLLRSRRDALFFALGTRVTPNEVVSLAERLVRIRAMRLDGRRICAVGSQAFGGAGRPQVAAG
ncbi:MAG: hypothetical protein EOM24_20485 [Chloroflexia bacterium]|nr:hypothetical protein [Chloroflexia bacterium]